MCTVRTFYPMQSGYRTLQMAVSDHFYQHHRALPHPSPDQFSCLTSNSGNVPGYGCIGISWAHRQKLFSEYYIDVELASQYAIQRSQLVEIGQFSSFGVKGAGRFLLAHVLRSLSIQRYRHAVLTATAKVRDMLALMDIDFDDFGAASIARVRDKNIDWGTYYRNQPRVIVIDLSNGFARLAHTEWHAPT